MSSLVSELEEDTENLELEMDCLVQQMASLTSYLATDDATDA